MALQAKLSMESMGQTLLVSDLGACQGINISLAISGRFIGVWGFDCQLCRWKILKPCVTCMSSPHLFVLLVGIPTYQST